MGGLCGTTITYQILKADGAPASGIFTLVGNSINVYTSSRLNVNTYNLKLTG